MKKNEKKYTLCEIIFFTICIVLTTYAYAHLISPDPYALFRFRWVYSIPILWGIRIGIPILTVVIIVIYYKVKFKKVHLTNIILVCVSLLITCFVFFPVASYLYGKAVRIEEKLSLYHPFLQLKPPEVHNIPLKDNNTTRIFTLGGSTTEWKDKSTKTGWPSRVEKLLQGNINDNIEIFNFGRQWYSTLHTLINYEVNIRPHKPDVIIVMHAINDLLCNADFSYLSHGKFRDDYGHFYGAVNRIIARGNFIQKMFREINFWSNKPRQLVSQKEFPGIPVFQRNLNTLIDIAEVDGTKVVLMTQPYLYKEDMPEDEIKHCAMLKHESVGPEKRWSYLSAYWGMKAYNETIIRIAQKRNIPFINLEPQLPKDLEHFTDGVHYKNKTYDKIAEYVSAELVKLGVVQ